MANLKGMGFPVDNLQFDPDLVYFFFPFAYYLFIFTSSQLPSVSNPQAVVLIYFFFLFVKVIRGLVIDKENGNLVKADRFGYIKRAMHGTKMLSTQAVRYICTQAVCMCVCVCVCIDVDVICAF
jgi:5' nucleotidase family